MHTEYVGGQEPKKDDTTAVTPNQRSRKPEQSGFNQLALALQRMNAKKVEKKGGSDATEAA